MPGRADMILDLNKQCAEHRACLFDGAGMCIMYERCAQRRRIVDGAQPRFILSQAHPDASPQKIK